MIGGIKPAEEIHKVLIFLNTLWLEYAIEKENVSVTQIEDKDFQIAIFLDVSEDIANEVKSRLNQSIKVMRKKMYDLTS